MPKVPVMEQNQRMRPGNPTGFQSSRNARLQGDAISGFGNAVTGFGAALQRSEKKKSDAQRRLAEADFKSEYTKRLQDEAVRISKLPSADADQDKDEFDLGSAEIQHEVIDEMSEKYGGKYTGNFGALAGGVNNGFRSEVILGSLKKQKMVMQRSLTATTSQLNGNLYDNPNSFEDSTKDYTRNVSGVMHDLGASPDDILASDRAGHKALATTAIDGYLNQKEYAEAKYLLLHRAGHLYDSDETRAELKRIRDTQTDDLSQSQRQNDRALNLREKNHKKVQQEIATQARLMLSNANTPAAQNKALEFIKKNAKQNNLAYSQFGGLLSDGVAKFKEVDALSGYDVAQEVFKADSDKDYDKVLNRIGTLHETGNMLATTATTWESVVNSQRKANASDPSMRALYKGYSMKLESLNKPMDMIEKMTDSLNKNVLMRRKIESDAQFQILKGKGVPPALAYKKVVETHFRGTDSIGLFPGYKGVPKTHEDLTKFAAWGRAAFNGASASKIKEFRDYAMKVKDAILVDEITNNVKVSDGKAGPSPVTAPSMMEVEALSKELFDFDELFKDRGDDLPLIYRRK